MKMHRREFLKGVGGAAAGLALGLGSEQARADEQPKLRWGLIGTGKRSWQHIRVIKQFPTSEIAAICDIQPDRMDAAQKLISTPVSRYDKYQDLLSRTDLNVILVATPNYCHSEEVVAALGKGYDVLTEKPMGITSAECNQMIEAAKSSGKILQVGLQLRYSAFYQKVHSLLADGIIGNIKYVWFNEFRGDWAKQSADPEIDNKINWRFYNKLSGGTLLEKSCHYFDLFRWFIDSEPTRVMAVGGINVYDHRDTLDHATVAIEFANGCKATHGLSMYAPHNEGFILIGDKGSLELNMDANEIRVCRLAKAPEIIKAVASGKDTGGHVGTREMHESFVDCVRNRKAPLTDPIAGKESIRVGLAGELSVREQRAVKMTEIPA